MRARREHRRRHRVRLDCVCVPFAAAEFRADHGQVSGDDVDRVGGLAGGECRNQPPDVVGVRLVRLGRGQREHLGRVDRVPLAQERKRDHPPRLAPRGRPGDDVIGGPVAHRAAQGHAGRLGPGAQGVEFGAVVVIAADRDDVGAGRPQRRQRPGDDALRIRRRRGRVEQVAGHDDEVGLLGLRRCGRHRPARRCARPVRERPLRTLPTCQSDVCRIFT